MKVRSSDLLQFPTMVLRPLRPIKPNRHRNMKLTPNLQGKITTEHELKLFCTEIVARHDLIYCLIYLIANMVFICICNIMTE